MKDFNFYQPTNIHFKKGGLNDLGELCNKYGKNCLLITSTPIEALVPLYNRTIEILENAGVSVTHFSKVEPNPTTTIVNEAIALATEIKADVIVSLGGGSTIDTGKIVSLCKGATEAPFEQLFAEFTSPFGDYKLPFGSKLPLIAVSTTAGTGSQCTQAAVITDVDSHMKSTIFSKDIFPTECIVDPELTMTLPYYMTACTGFDAFSHAFESYLGDKLAPHAELMALEAIKAVATYLPKLKTENNIDFRANLCYADTLGGITLANGGAYAPHPLGEIISSYATKVNHGQSLALVYPSCANHTWKEKIEKYAIVARIFDSSYCDKSDEQAAQALGTIFNSFIEEIGLNNRVTIEQSEKEQILNCPILKFLPMASEETLKNILIDSI